MTPIRYPSRTAQSQQGVALIVVLLLLLVVTLLGLASMRGTLLQERMAANTVARGLAFQVAEALLREAEGFATSKPSLPTSGCVSGVCARPNPPGSDPAWKAEGFWESGSGYRLANTKIDGIPGRYVIEDYGTSDASSCTGSIDMSAVECEVENQIYRVVVRSKAPNGAEVVLQSMYVVP